MLVLAISGSLRARSYNSALLRSAGDLLPPAARLELFDELHTLPPYSEDHDLQPAPHGVAGLRARIAAADALLIATPEYNASLPGQLKNALDWASRPYPHNALRGKPAAVVGASTGLFGAVWAQAEVRKVLRTAGAQVVDAELPVGDAERAFDQQLRLLAPHHRSKLATILGELATAASTDCAESPVRCRHRSGNGDRRGAASRS